jgi:ABC-type sugar transport system, periplasmic component
MGPEQRKGLSELVNKVRSGRMTRRSFLEGAGRAGLSSGVAVSLLEACGGSSNSSGGNGAATSIIWQSESDPTNTYQALVDTFNADIGHKKGIYVIWDQGSASTNAILARYTNMLRALDGSIDVLSIDTIYVAQFAASGWLRVITEQQWPVSERTAYLDVAAQSCSYQGKVWAVPFRADAGVLYYRTDLLKKPPATWDELVSLAQGLQRQCKYGYVWQGAQYESLVCNFCEVLYGYGGRIFALTDPSRVVVNSAEGKAALEQMMSWVGTISPRAVTTYSDDLARQVWQNGDAVFMRNWPYAYVLGQDPTQSQIVDKFAARGLCSGGSNSIPHSCLGGWNLGMNTYSSHHEQSWEFINYMLQEKTQEMTALGSGLGVANRHIYYDKDIIAKHPLSLQLLYILEHALPRPISPSYTSISDVLQLHVHRALRHEISAQVALTDLEADLKKIVSRL